MLKILPFFYMICLAFLLFFTAGCSSTGYSGNAGYYHRSGWDYDRYYRSGVNHHYNRPVARENVRSGAKARAGARAGGRGGGGRR